MLALDIRALGTLAVTLDGKPIKGFRAAKVYALLVYLAVESATPHRREGLIDLLWSKQPLKAGQTNLRQALRRLQKAIDNQSAESASPR